MKAKIFCDWNFTLDAEFDSAVELYIDNACTQFDHASNAIKILILWEPPHLFPDLYFHALAEGKRYNYILTYYDKVLEQCSNAVFFRYDACWIGDNYVPTTQKKFGVSTVIGYKRYTQGHLLRHQLWENRSLIKIPSFFFLSQHGGHPCTLPDEVFKAHRENLILGDSKDPLFEYQFHIVIENVKMKSMFSEKLTDTCRALSVPIYWGCSDVEQFYDTRGMFVCNDMREIIKICNNIKEDTYHSMLPFVQKNHQRSMEYNNGKKDLINKINELIKR